MLGKLIKHEFHATRRILIPLNLAVILITLVGVIILNTNIFDNINALPLTSYLLIIYIIAIAALSLASTIYLLVRFYRNLFTSEGYLMFTLPVTPVQLLNAKLITAFLWSLLNSVLAMISGFALGFAGGSHASKEELEGFMAGFSYALTGTANAHASFQNIFGYSITEFLLLFLALILVASFSSIVMGYVSISLGQLIEKHKMACSIGFYIAIYIVTQIISNIILIISNITIISDNQADSLTITGSIYHSLLPASTIINLGFGILFYVITFFIIQKNVNLD